MSDYLPTTPPGWKVTRLSDVANYQNGHAFYKDGYSSEGLIAIDLYNVDEEGRLRFGERDKHVSLELCERFSKFKLNRNDLVMVMTDMTQRLGILGKCAVIDQDDRYILNQRLGRVTANESEVLTRYLFYFINSEYFLKPLRALAKGAVQKYVNTGDIKENSVLLPPLPVQRRIAGILSAYDELMENSQRRIRLLEAMARALYREWFVHFRIPAEVLTKAGASPIKLVASPLGDIPQGWEVRRIDEALRFDSGRTIKKEERENGDTPVYGANGIIGGTANSPMADQCIIMGKIGSCGALHRSHKPCWVTNNAFLIQPAAIQSLELAWQVLLDVDFRQYIGGAANPYMPINTFGQHEVVIPAESVQSEFEMRAGPLRRLVEALSERTENLRRTRDLLLPRLLSGQVNLTTN